MMGDRLEIRDLGDAVAEIAQRERHRIELVQWLGLCGACPPPADVDVGRWRSRLARLEAAAELLTALAPREATVRAIAAAGPLPNSQKKSAAPPPAGA
jgi:hypothetical protein